MWLIGEGIFTCRFSVLGKGHCHCIFAFDLWLSSLAMCRRKTLAFLFCLLIKVSIYIM